MQIKLFLNKNINDNANFYYEKAKKLKRKLPGIDNAIQRTKKDIEELEKKRESLFVKKQREETINLHRRKEWFDKFRWTKTSSGFLFVIGKDATTNEILIKKHMQKDDVVFHTEEQGSPFGLIKEGRDKVSKNDIRECAEYLACFSRQWKSGYGQADVFWVYPEQISKKALTGEYIAKGSFMVHGEKNILKNVNLRICIGVEKKKIETEDEKIDFEEPFSGSEEACKLFCKNRYVKLEPGTDNYKKLNVQIKKKLKCHIDNLPKYIPNFAKIMKR